MFLSGDEFGDTRFGNNNPYCQDNEISWLDWTFLDKNRDLFRFFQYMISFRQAHPAIRKDLEPSYSGLPSMSIRGLNPEEANSHTDTHSACVLFAGYDEERQYEDLVYVAVNTYWYSTNLTLPDLPEGYVWKIAVNTGDPKQQIFEENEMPAAGRTLLLGERSVIVFVGTKQD